MPPAAPPWPGGVPARGGSGLPRWVLIAAGVVVVAVAVTAVTVWIVRRNAIAERWSGFPRTLVCAPDDSEPADSLRLPAAARVTAIDVAHPGGDQIMLSLHFLTTVPTVPRAVRANGGVIDAPGTIEPGFTISNMNGRPASSLGQLHDDDVYLEAPKHDQPEWAISSGQEINGRAGQAIPVRSSVRGNVVDVTLDLHGYSSFLRDGQVQLGVVINNTVYLGGFSDQSVKSFDQQSCPWSSTAAASSEQTSTTTPAPALVPSYAPAPTVAAPPQTSNPAAPIQVWGFRSPTGNLACVLSTTGAACDIKEHQYVVPAAPSNCAGFGDRVGMDVGAPAMLACHTTSFFDQGLPTQTYNAPLTAGSISCVLAEQTGVSCRDAVSGHGFTLSKQGYTLS